MANGPTPPTKPEDVPVFDDPCTLYRKLRAQYEQSVSGTRVAKTEYHGNGQERHLEFSVGSTTQLKELMDRAYEECQRSLGNNNPKRRFAIRAGAGRIFR